MNEEFMLTKRLNLHPSNWDIADNISNALGINHYGAYGKIVDYVEALSDRCGGIFLSLNTSNKNYSAQNILDRLKKDGFNITCFYGYVDENNVNHSLFEVRWNNLPIAQKALELV